MFVQGVLQTVGLFSVIHLKSKLNSDFSLCHSFLSLLLKTIKFAIVIHITYLGCSGTGWSLTFWFCSGRDVHQVCSKHLLRL